jgi:hypothetical protein
MQCRFKMTIFSAYHNLNLTRDDKGVLRAEFHTTGGPFIMTALSHTGLSMPSTGLRKTWITI